jgi:hypothetical protein
MEVVILTEGKNNSSVTIKITLHRHPTATSKKPQTSFEKPKQHTFCHSLVVLSFAAQEAVKSARKESQS